MSHTFAQGMSERGVVCTRAHESNVAMTTLYLLGTLLAALFLEKHACGQHQGAANQSERGPDGMGTIDMQHMARRQVRSAHLVELRGRLYGWHVEHHSAQLCTHVDGGCLHTPGPALCMRMHRLPLLGSEAHYTAAGMPWTSLRGSKAPESTIVVGSAVDRATAPPGEGFQLLPRTVLLGNTTNAAIGYVIRGHAGQGRTWDAYVLWRQSAPITAVTSTDRA